MAAYAPCVNVGVEDHMVYKPQERYIQEKGVKTNPKALFRYDLLAVLQKWQAKGDRVVLIMDTTKNVLHGAMCKQPT